MQVLYRYFDEDETLLYVGISGDFLSRSKQHLKKSKWFKYSRTARLEFFKTRAEVENAEIEAIKKEKPLYNTVYNNDLIVEKRAKIDELGEFDCIPMVKRAWMHIDSLCKEKFSLTYRELGFIAGMRLKNYLLNKEAARNEKTCEG